jgi:hypothetical protein
MCHWLAAPNYAVARGSGHGFRKVLKVPKLISGEELGFELIPSHEPCRTYASVEFLRLCFGCGLR